MNKKRILLIDPKSVRHGPPLKVKNTDNFINQQYVDAINRVVNERCPDNDNKAMHGKYVTNYGLLMLSSLLKPDYDVTYINGDYFSTADDYISYLLKEIGKYDLVSLTSTTPQFNEVKKIAILLKKVKPNIKIILGGPHTRYYLNHDVEECFDVVCIGYGIDKSKEVVDGLLNGSITSRKIITNYYYDVPKDFSAIPNDKIMDTMLYSYINFGCPNDCKYCVEHKFVDKIAFNCPNDKFNEIKELVNNYNVKFVHIADSDFLMFKDTVIKFIDYIKREKLNFCFSVNTSPITLNKYINDPILFDLKELGLVELLIGAEHFSKTVLDNLAKRYDTNIFKQALKYAKHNVKIPIISLYTLVGLPGEYHNEIRENINTIKELKDADLFDFTFPKFFVPYPDSDIYLHPAKYNVKIKSENWEEYHRWQLPRPIIINGMSDDDYVNEIVEINKIVLGDRVYEDDSSTSLCKKR